MREVLQEALQTALQGTLMGGGVGAVIGVVASLANHLLFEKEVPLQYCLQGKWKTFYNMEAVQDTKILDDIRTMHKYRHMYASAFDQACRIVQHLINVYIRFQNARAEGKDGLRYIAKFQHAAVRADACWRGLCYAIKDDGNRIDSEESTTAMMNIHFTLESLLSEMREQFRLQPQLDAAVAKSPLYTSTNVM